MAEGVATAPETTRSFAIGVDVGGTHTDLILSGPDGLARGKAFTTHDEYSDGILAALETAAGQWDLTANEVLRRCRTFVNGTTIVTNVLTELRGAKVGVLITQGFRDTLRIAGGARTSDYDDHVSQIPPPDVVARDCIEEISERVDSDGRVVVALDEQGVREAASRLREQGAEAVAVCYLWSFAEPAHEIRTVELLAEEMPGVFVTRSSEIRPVIREYERFMSAVLNCFSHRATTRYIDGLHTRLKAGGFTGSLSFFQGVGGSVGLEAVHRQPITLLASGPAGGVMAARHVGERLGLRNVLVGDMGGTSFDTSVLADLEPTIAKRATFGRLKTGVNIVDVVSVGAGGGSIAWLDARGVPQVGPHSAGSQPGPACYGRGGVEPTVTDAMVVLGLIDPDNYLRGRHVLDAAAARTAIATRIAEPLGWSIERAAIGIHDLAVVNMAGALREVSIERGYDPRDFTMLAYGGMSPMFAIEICRKLGCGRIVIPDNSAAFSAFGVLIADYVRQYERTVQWLLSVPDGCEAVNQAAAALLGQAVADARSEGIAEDELELRRSAEMRFLGQTYEVTVTLPDRDLTPADGEQLAQEFPSIYERQYGKGTAWKGSPVVLLNYAVTATYRRAKPDDGPAAALQDVAAKPVRQRVVTLPDTHQATAVSVFEESALPPGSQVVGPCIVDVGDTTVFVPGGASCARDAQRNFHLSVDAEGSRS